ncbi:aldehyde dehydrogenase family protein [Candidatus Leptofilum sp.]|uniref:aldehyde dehydrogenase family protein n=1 Tax=Candidatus Leptofilum sp. TaxID=3241576 RepID=UPI003B5ABCF7
MNNVKIPDLTDYIAGEFLPPTVAITATSASSTPLSSSVQAVNRNPHDNSPIGQQMATSEANLERALAAAWQVHQSGVWRNLPIAERADLVTRMGAWLAERAEDIAQLESLTTGIVINTSRLVNMITHLTFTASAEMLRGGSTLQTLSGELAEVEVHRQPWGPAACIAPWNAPAALAAHKVGAALAAGCPVILKPSEWSPYSAVFLARAAEAVDLPAGVFQLVNGRADVGAYLVNDARIRCVSFTGGLAGGRAVAQACARDFKPAQLELGGNNAMVVLADADLDKTAQGIVAGMTTLNGQWCRALGRLIVQDTIYNDLLERTLEALAAVKVGHALDESSQMGPLVHARHRGHLQTAVAHLQSRGGTVHQVTPLPDLPGTFFAPALITGIDSSETLEEIFGPVTAVHPFKTDAEAVQLANQTPYGLGGYVFGEQEHALTIARQMETGGVKVNGVSLIGLHPMAPRPAWKLSGFGEEGTAETFHFFMGRRVVGVAGV